eukprot:g1321.t1
MANWGDIDDNVTGDWADIDEDEFEVGDIDEVSSKEPTSGITNELPEEEITVDSKTGIFTKITYSMENGKKKKKTERYRTFKFEKKVHPICAIRRRQWKKFGQSTGVLNGIIESETTQKSKDPVYIEDPAMKMSNADDEDNESNDMVANMKALLARRKQGASSKWGESSMLEKDSAAPSAGAGGRTGKYIPVHLRGDGATASRIEQSTYQDDGYRLRVTNLSENAREAHVEDLFQRFGRCKVYIAKDKYTGLSRGIAYITYFDEDSMLNAIAKMNGQGFDHLILRVEKAKPRAPREGGSAPGVNRAHMTGYGKALPQGPPGSK